VPVWSDSIPQFDELYAVSDLHMGGFGVGAQIFNSGQELAALIDHLRGRTGRKVALVINGDMVDFLAEPNSKAFDPDGSADKLTRIAEDASFKPVWDALKAFVRTDRHCLVVTLGNHDLELALPWLRTRLCDILADNDEATRGRIILAFDGGFLCRVGKATVLCIHGNEVDDWNITDHETIRRFGQDLQQGRSVEPWIPNAGTYLVVEAMNDIKKGYPFVDLLKPELEAVIPVLLAIAPDKHQRITAAFGVLKRLALDKVRRAAGWLSAQEWADGNLRLDGPLPIQRSPMNHDALMAIAEDRLQRGVKPISLVSDSEQGERLGLARATWSWLRGEDTRKTLRSALEGLQKDRSFEWSLEDDTFRRLDEAIGSDVDFILAGHTHLERALHRRKTKGFYLNSGTWVRLIRLRPEVLVDQTEFNKVYGALAAGTMEALDGHVGLVERRHTVVSVRDDAGSGTRGELMHWSASGSDTLTPVDQQAGMTKT
jgi:UDP-2,3-diacylglucosamine pyrophosphatase LpxH